MEEQIAVLMSVYKNSISSELEECFESLLSQTYKAEEYVLVEDGPISIDLTNCIEKYKAILGEKLVIVVSKSNIGLGNALKLGMEYCTKEIIARMDTDDICDSTRFEKQLEYLLKNKSTSIVGSNIAEFIENKDNIVSIRTVPISHEEICNYLKKRCPFNHMSVMFKKAEVEKAGGYLDWHYDEDSYLWVRMYLVGCKFANIPENLVYARINNDTFKRRGGMSYYKSEKALFKYMYEKKVINWFDYQIAKAIRFILQVLMPNSLRQWVFKTFARK